jgi:hypothetical protein
MLYESSLESIKEATVIYYNGQAKPWLDVAFPHLRPFKSKYVNYSHEFIMSLLDNVISLIDPKPLPTCHNQL